MISSSPDAPGLRAQLATVAGRSLTRTVRQRRLLILPFVFPMILFAINSSSLSAAAHIRGFPPVNYTAFALAVPFLMGAMLGAVSAGTDLAYDIESGFLGRLALTPMRRTAILFGQLGGALTLAVVQSIAFVLVGLAAGVTIASGLLGALVLIGWFHAVATYNPISYLVEGMRSLIITGWDAQALALGFGIAGGIAILSLLLADAGLKTRLVTA